MIVTPKESLWRSPASNFPISEEDDMSERIVEYVSPTLTQFRVSFTIESQRAPMNIGANIWQMVNAPGTTNAWVHFMTQKWQVICSFRESIVAGIENLGPVQEPDNG